MQAMILAAGRGERLRPITDHCPKPLVTVAGKPLIVHQLENLVAHGFTQVVINVSYRAQAIMDYLEDGKTYGIQIHYSIEPPVTYGTAGGIRYALDYLTNTELFVINADVLCDYPIGKLPTTLSNPAHIVLTSNPPDNPNGDFSLHNGVVTTRKQATLTYSGIGLYQRKLFTKLPYQSYYCLGQLLHEQIQANHIITADHHQGLWYGINDTTTLKQAEQAYCHTKQPSN